MAFINKNDFSIVSYVQDYKIAEDYFECDDLIAPAISLLNKKGYKTTYCCSGHPFGHIGCAIMEESPSEHIPKEQILRIESSECVFDEWKEAGSEFSLEEFPYYVVYREILATNLYVTFQGVYELPNLPEDKGFKHFINYNGSSVYHNLHKYDTSSETFKDITRVYEINKAFYEWVEQLPYLNQ